MEPTEVTELVSRLRHAFPVPKWTAARFAIYAEYLEDLELEPTRAAVDELIRTRTESFMPSVGEIRRRALAVRQRARMLELAAQERRQLLGPRDPIVREVIRGCIERLTRRYGEPQPLELPVSEAPTIDDAEALTRRSAARQRLKKQAQTLSQRV